MKLRVGLITVLVVAIITYVVARHVEQRHHNYYRSQVVGML